MCMWTTSLPTKDCFTQNMRCNETMITGQTLRDAILSGANNIANQRTRVG